LSFLRPGSPLALPQLGDPIALPFLKSPNAKLKPKIASPVPTKSRRDSIGILRNSITKIKPMAKKSKQLKMTIEMVTKNHAQRYSSTAPRSTHTETSSLGLSITAISNDNKLAATPNDEEFVAPRPHSMGSPRMGSGSGSGGVLRKSSGKVCMVAICQNKQLARGYCDIHINMNHARTTNGSKVPFLTFPHDGDDSEVSSVGWDDSDDSDDNKKSYEKGQDRRPRKTEDMMSHRKPRPPGKPSPSKPLSARGEGRSRRGIRGGEGSSDEKEEDVYFPRKSSRGSGTLMDTLVNADGTPKVPHRKLSDQAVHNLIRKANLNNTIRMENRAILDVRNDQKEQAAKAVAARIKAVRDQEKEDSKVNERALQQIEKDRDSLKAEKEERRGLLLETMHTFDLDITAREEEAKKIGTLCGIKTKHSKALDLITNNERRTLDEKIEKKKEDLDFVRKKREKLKRASHITAVEQKDRSFKMQMLELKYDELYKEAKRERVLLNKEIAGRHDKLMKMKEDCKKEEDGVLARKERLQDILKDHASKDKLADMMLESLEKEREEHLKATKMYATIKLKEDLSKKIKQGDHRARANLSLLLREEAKAAKENWELFRSESEVIDAFRASLRQTKSMNTDCESKGLDDTEAETAVEISNLTISRAMPQVDNEEMANKKKHIVMQSQMQGYHASTIMLGDMIDEVQSRTISDGAFRASLVADETFDNFSEECLVPMEVDMLLMQARLKSREQELKLFNKD